MGDEGKHDDEEDQDGRPVLDVLVQLAGDAAQSQETDHLQGAEQAAHVLKKNIFCTLAGVGCCQHYVRLALAFGQKLHIGTSSYTIVS